MRTAVYEEAPVFLGMDIHTGRCNITCEVAHDLFKDIFDGDDSLDISVLINDKRDTLFLFLKVNQLFL